jgi:hypothetical protein
MHASQDLGRKIEHGKRVLAEKSKTVQPTDQVQPSSDIMAAIVTDGNRSAAEPIQGHTPDLLNKPENNKPKRRSSRSPADPTDAAATGTTGTKISLEEMEKIKDRVDHCLATNIESDLVSRHDGGFFVVIIIAVLPSFDTLLTKWTRSFFALQGTSRTDTYTIQENHQTVYDRKTTTGALFAPQSIHDYAHWSDGQEPLQSGLWANIGLYAIHNIRTFDYRCYQDHVSTRICGKCQRPWKPGSVQIGIARIRARIGIRGRI